VSAPQPYRVVDRENQGWYQASQPGGGTLYTASYGFERDLPPRTYEELAATRAPLRPVEPVADADVAELERLFADAGRKTVTTLAAALEAVFHRVRTEHGGDRPGHWMTPGGGFDSYQFARRTLMAGREGSWESQFLAEIILFGNGLNLAPESRTMRDPGARRAAGPGKRVNQAARDQIADVLWRWVASPFRYTEVAETLASIVSRYCDEHGGWRAVADQWLQPGGLARADFSACYRLLFSQSTRFDSGVI
jgi:hypothetical protein